MFGKKIVCGKCNSVNPPDAVRCVHCGEKLLSIRKNIVWNNCESDISQRFDLSESANHFDKTLIVANGTQVIMVVGGECKGVLPAGTYDKFGTTLKRCGVVNQEKIISIIFIDAAELTITFSILDNEIQTRDGQNIGADGKLSIRINEPEDFYQNYFKNKSSLRITDLNRDFQEPISYALRNFVSNYSLSQLHGDNGVNSRLEKEIISHLNYVFDSKGIEAMELNWIKFKPRESFSKYSYT